MKHDLKNEWVYALRSGQYSQTKRSLMDVDGYCCLGVLCDVLSKKDIGKWVDGTFTYENAENAALLPFNVAELVDIEWEQQRLLMTMNDDGKSFAEIANYIEKNL